MSGTKDCKFCDKKGLLWLPLRYSAVGAHAPEAIASLPQITGKLGKGVTDITLGEARYAVRLLRPGYLYVLLERKGIKYWDAYMVLEDAFLYQFSPEEPPQTAPEFSCEPHTCGINASMVAIPSAQEVPRLWALFTPSPLTKAKLAEYKANADKYAGEGKLQTFSPANWLSGGTAQPHTLMAPELLTMVAEYLLFTQPGNPYVSSLGNALAQQLFPASEHAYCGAPPNEKGEYAGRLGSLYNTIKRNGYAAMVLYDHIGVTQELNDFRNDAYKPIDDFMGKSDGTEPDNKWKFDVYNAIGQWRVLYDKGLVANAQDSVELVDMKRRARVEPIFPDDTVQMRRFKMQANNPYIHPSRSQWEASNPQKIEAFEVAREHDEEFLIERAQINAKKEWDDKYASQLDLSGMEKFIARMNAISKQSSIDADKRSSQHIAWLTAPRLLDAFEIYDQNMPVSGEALRAQVVSCIFGMGSSAQAESILATWATAISIERENLLLRAFTRDQKNVKKEADKALSEVTALVAGMSTMSAMPAASWQKAIKGLVSACKSTDSALDEWMRNQGQSKNYLNPKHIANVEARFFYLVSTLTRVVARKGIGGKVETAVVARANAFMHAWLGDLAEQIEFKTLNASIDPAKWDDLKKKHAQAEALEKASEQRKTAQQRRAYRQAKRAKAALQISAIDLIADAQLKAKLQIAQGAQNLGWSNLQLELENSAKQHQNYKIAAATLKNEALPRDRVSSTPSPTNNYHHFRIGAALAGIESISLLTKIPQFKGWDITVAEISASACSLGSILLDMMYAYTKSVRELPRYAAIRGVELGGDIVRGGFKFSAGFLAAVAGTITAFLDWNAMKNEKDPIQKAILFTRSITGGASTGAGMLAAYSYSGPLLKHLAEKEGRSIFMSKLTKFIGKGASALAERVLLLRIVAWLGWVGVVITVVDISYAGYRWYMDSTAVQRWLSRCVFRKDKSNRSYRDVKEELKEFVKAQHPGQELEESVPEANVKSPIKSAQVVLA